ncbi:MAG: hypothetical protein COT18_08750 [Elusimicrobia bacterium CG08_land_8_20_14_0_20_59_10]|nr:MAG: hypothetical protein COT18_08750 [Elusimicrobia bacterium CG08_land_8_20_14_0_20_59_10]
MNELFYERSVPHIILPWLAWAYIKLLGLTTKISIQGSACYPGAAVYSVWHRQEVWMIYLNQGRNVCGLVSKSKDGEYMARILRRFGFSVIRGSTTSGGVMSLRALIKAARGGHSIAITPDGPRGPMCKVQPGSIYLARTAGVPIVPAACAMSRKKIFGSWDKYQFPLPFGRMQAVYGEPFFVAAADDVAAKAAELENILNSLTDRAEQLLAARP